VTDFLVNSNQLFSRLVSDAPSTAGGAFLLVNPKVDPDTQAVFTFSGDRTLFYPCDLPPG
jgi:hypothetical protein